MDFNLSALGKKKKKVLIIRDHKSPLILQLLLLYFHLNRPFRLMQESTKL